MPLPAPILPLALLCAGAVRVGASTGKVMKIENVVKNFTEVSYSNNPERRRYTGVAVDCLLKPRCVLVVFDGQVGVEELKWVKQKLETEPSKRDRRARKVRGKNQ